MEQLLPECLHIKQEPETLSEGQETNTAACSVKCEDEDEEEKPQGSELHWRQLTEVNIKEEPSTYSLNELMENQTLGINSKAPESAQNPDPSSLVLQGPDGTTTDSSQTEDSGEDEDDDEDSDHWQKPLSDTESEAKHKFDSPKKKRKMCDSSGASEMSIDKEERTFECDFCRKCFIRKCNLESHMRVHTGERPFECDYCSETFTQKASLKIHESLHTGEKPFKCDFCRKRFIQKGNLLVHRRVHTGEKPYKCDVCSKSFTQKICLQIHMRNHTGEKPFKCDVCNKCFNHNSNLQTHVRSHTREKPFK